MAIVHTKHSFLKYKTLRWLLIPVIVLHNFEEWLTFPVYGEIGEMIATFLDVPFEKHPWPVTQLALILVTIIPVLLIIWAAIGQQRKWKDWIVSFLAGIFFVNVFLPHIPAAILAKGYSPGIITALTINLPFCILLWRRTIQENILSHRNILFAIIAATLLIIPILIVIFAISRTLVSLI